MPGFTQENRLISLSTPLEGAGYPPDTLLLASFSGHEAISRLFSFHLDLLSEKAAKDFKGVKPKDIVNKHVTICVTQSDNTPRYFNGIVSRIALSGEDDVFVRYQMEVVPWTWLLTRCANCKIFHNKQPADIIQQIFSNRGFTDFKFQLSGAFPTLEYCVQYRETDFNFISRIMEQYGIYYYFEHEEHKHTMVISNNSVNAPTCPNQKEAGFDVAGGGLEDDDVVTSIHWERFLQSSQYTLTDYNFKTPSANLLVNETTRWPSGNNQGLEIYDYPGDYINRNDGTAVAKLRMGELETGETEIQGSSVCRAFTTGYQFQLTGATSKGLNKSYLLTEIQHSADVGGSYMGNSGQGHYSNHFTSIPINVPFLPARLTPKPFVQGPQTAVVVGSGKDGSAQGNEIQVDEFGRVIVLFPWDREKDCSCYVRVSQEWAGLGYGAMAIPRIGQEVIVSFLEGDPDRPIITGRVYNATQTVPYGLPGNQTRSTFMTRSSKDGSASTYNELRFEDKMGAEQVFIRAQYDQDNYVLNDSRESVGNNRSLIVKTDQMESVGGDLHSQVTGNVFEKVSGNTNLQVTGNASSAVTGNVNSQVTGNFVEAVSGDWNSNVTGNINQKAGQNLSIQVAQNLYETSGTNFAHQAGEQIHLKAGMAIVIEAATQITLVVGSNSVVLSPAGVAITGTLVQINSGGSPGSGCGSSPTDPTSPVKPDDPKKPDQADNGSKGTKM
jgi:type VI secretion system secreted protein VgrG